MYVLAGLALGNALLAVAAPAAPEPPIYRPLSVSLVHPVTTFVHKDPIISGLSLNLLDGNPRRVYGLQLGGILNRTRERMYGFQVAGGVNLAFGALAGVQVAAFVNVVLRPSWGVQLGGLWNHASSVWTPSATGFSGVQIGGFGNSADLMVGLQWSIFLNVAGQMSGVQASWFNVAYLKLDGLQLGLGNMQVANWNVRQSAAKPTLERLLTLRVEAFMDSEGPNDPFWPLSRSRSHIVQLGVTNVAQDAAGVQVAALLNTAFRFRGLQWALTLGNMTFTTVHGAQIASGYNYAGTYMEGVQLSVVNVCRALRGVQLGLINICGRVVGAQIGAINIAYKNKLPFFPVLNVGR